MPKISAYETPQTVTPTGKVSNNTDLSQAAGYGRLAQNIGEGVARVGGEIEQRETQDELSKLNSMFSDARAEWSQRLDDDIRNGSIDSNKVQQDFDSYMDKMSEGISTRSGQNYFDREKSRLSGYVLRTTTRGQAALAGIKAQEEWKNSVNKNASSLYTDPSQFQDVYNSSLETIDAQVESGSLPANAADKLKRLSGTELAKGAVRGWARLDPDLAQKKLDEFDQYWDSDVKAQMQGYINQQKAASEIEDRRREKKQADAMKKLGEAWEQEAIPKLVSSDLSPQDVINSPLDSTNKLQWLKLIEESTKKKQEASPGLENEMFRRINLPDDDPDKITDISQLTPYVGKGLNINSVQKLGNWMKKTPEGEAIRVNRKKLIDYATARLVKKDSFGTSDPRGEFLLSQFMIDLQEAEKKAREDGVPVTELYNPHSKNYFGFQADKYKRSQKEIMQDTIQDMRRTSVSGQVNFNPPKAPQVIQRKEGESIEDWLKRKRAGGGE